MTFQTNYTDVYICISLYYIYAHVHTNIHVYIYIHTHIHKKELLHTLTLEMKILVSKTWPICHQTLPSNLWWLQSWGTYHQTPGLGAKNCHNFRVERHVSVSLVSLSDDWREYQHHIVESWWCSRHFCLGFFRRFLAGWGIFVCPQQPRYLQDL